MGKKTVEADLTKGISIRDPREGEPFRCNPDPNSQERLSPPFCICA